MFEIGIDEVSWRKQHNYLTLVSNHRSGKVVWGAEGKDTKTADGFFDELGKERSAPLSADSMDMGKAYLKSVSKEEHAPQATVCIVPFHAVAFATTAFDDVRRAVWNDMRAVNDKAAKKFKDARWSLMKNPTTSPTSRPRACAVSRDEAVICGAPTGSRSRAGRNLRGRPRSR